MNLLLLRFLMLAVPAALFLAACDSSGDDGNGPPPLSVQLATDLEADPAVGRDSTTGQPISNGLFTLFDLENGSMLLSSSQTDSAIRHRDSASTTWDIGFRGTTLILNGGTSGPGSGAAQILKEAFADVKEAPESGYVADGDNECPTIDTPIGPMPGEPYAICTGSDNGWYTYNTQSNTILPTAGRTIVLKTGDGNYAKVRILSYYKGNPPAPTPSSPSRYYTFEYVVRTGASRDLTSAGN